ncbi:MAG: hypothetical protein J1E56_02230 [Ruminococcus sp.]|nr:hypothetical protein [Ruminococcus sp.]
MNDAKTNNFLNAIQKYADKQKQDMQQEIETFKAEEMKKAEDEGLKAAYDIIHKEMENNKTVITREFAKKEKESQDELFLERAKMMQTVFDKTTEKLIAYTSTEEYKNKLTLQAQNIAKLFGNKSCIIYINEKDRNFANQLQDCFGGETQVKATPEIKIGGIKVYCEEMNIIADETLDSKLQDQRQWFTENSGLKVV